MMPCEAENVGGGPERLRGCQCWPVGMALGVIYPNVSGDRHTPGTLRVCQQRLVWPVDIGRAVGYNKT